MAADRIFFDDLKGKGVDVVNEWLRGKGLEKLCGLFDTLECIINTLMPCKLFTGLLIINDSIHSLHAL